jgi:hypothetical protein
MNLTYHNKADIFCTAIVTVVTIIFSGRFLRLKVKTLKVFESCKHIIVVFLKDVEKESVRVRVIAMRAYPISCNGIVQP